MVTVVSGNRTLTASGQTRVAAFNGSAVFTGLTVRAPTEVILMSVCCILWLPGALAVAVMLAMHHGHVAPPLSIPSGSTCVARIHEFYTTADPARCCRIQPPVAWDHLCFPLLLESKLATR